MFKRVNHAINNQIAIVFLLIFLFLIYINSFYEFPSTYYSLLVFMLIVSFFKEETRLLIWSIIAFLCADFLFTYSIKLMDFTVLSIEQKILTNQLLYIFYVLLIGIVFYSFKKQKPSFLEKPNWQQSIPLLFYKKIPLPFFIGWTVIVYFFILLFLADKKNLSISLSLLIFSLLFAMVYSILQEVLWRSLLLTIFLKSSEKWPSILVTGIGSGFISHALGFSNEIISVFCIIGIFFSAITLKTKSIVPSLILQFFFYFFLGLFRMIFLGI